MEHTFEIYTGELEYEGITFIFVFDKKELRLIPPKDKIDEIETDWFGGEKSPGMNIFTKVPKMKKSSLEGQCNETGKKIIFITKKDVQIQKYNTVLVLSLVGYILCRAEYDSIDRINFCGPEINCIHPIGKAFSVIYQEDDWKNGELSIITNSFDETTTETQTFLVHGKEVGVHFSISRGVGGRVGETPLILNSSLVFDFNPTNDAEFLVELWRIAKKYIQYLCYSQNVTINRIELLAPYNDKKHVSFAEMFILIDKPETDMDSLKKGHYIWQNDIDGYEGKILNDIADSKLYMQHLPETFEKGYHIDAARFIMIMAAFEWEIRRIFPDFARQKKDGKKVTLANKISNAGKAMAPIMDIFSVRLYGFNGEKLDYDQIGSRLAKQRNNFSHGNLDQQFNKLVLLDLTYMEWLIYGMQLKYHNLPNKNIQRAINELFQRHIDIKDN